MSVFRSLPKSFGALTHLYLLRLLVDGDGFHCTVDDKRVTERGILRAAGASVDADVEPFEPKALLRALRDQLVTVEAAAPQPQASSTLSKNIAWMAGTLGLNQLEADIVLLLTLAHHANAFGKLLDRFGNLKTHEIHALVAIALRQPFDEVSSALRHTSRLVSAGLVWLDMRNKWTWENKIGLLNGVADQLMLTHDDPSTIFRSNLLRSSPACLDLDDYPHLTLDLKILEDYLRQAIAKRQAGVNVLVHGPAGTGKTELAKALAGRLGVPLFEVATEDRYGDIHRPEARFGAFQLAQGILRGEPSLILFDEIEDVFSRPSDEDDNPRRPRFGGGKKGWTNKILEQNKVPALWISNSLIALDRAYLRRFDYVLQVGIPPRSVRSKILDRYLADMPVTSRWRAMIADHDGLTPGAVERAAKVTRNVLETHPGADADAVVDRVLGNSLEALGSSRHPRTMPPSATTYRLEILNTDRDLGAICEGLKRTGSGRLCAWGPPGTGKSAFGHHLAKVLDRPLIVKRASDLQGKWLGETEQNMARMFQDATADNAVLLLDEADSFLQDRRGAERSWEVSQTNEMLCQLESFQGVFIASTNLKESLDQASLRRFDLKVKFDYLRREQSVTMFRDSLTLLGLQPDPNAERRVGSLRNLTPGDVAAALRQAQLSGASTAMAFAEMLVGECVIKVGGPRRGIGFQPPEVVD